MSVLAKPQPLFAIYHRMAGAQVPLDAQEKDISGIIETCENSSSLPRLRDWNLKGNDSMALYPNHPQST